MPVSNSAPGSLSDGCFRIPKNTAAAAAGILLSSNPTRVTRIKNQDSLVQNCRIGLWDCTSQAAISDSNFIGYYESIGATQSIPEDYVCSTGLLAVIDAGATGNATPKTNTNAGVLVYYANK